MAKRGRKPGYRSPNTKKCRSILENLYLMGYSQPKALEELHHLNLHLSSETVHRMWLEFRQQHTNALVSSVVRRRAV